MINYEISSPLAGVVCREKQNADDDDREKVAIMIIRVDVLLIVSISHALRREHTERDVGSRRRHHHDVEGEICMLCCAVLCRVVGIAATAKTTECLMTSGSNDVLGASRWHSVDGWLALRRCYYGSYFGHAQWSMWLAIAGCWHAWVTSWYDD